MIILFNGLLKDTHERLYTCNYNKLEYIYSTRQPQFHDHDNSCNLNLCGGIFIRQENYSRCNYFLLLLLIIFSSLYENLSCSKQYVTKFWYIVTCSEKRSEIGVDLNISFNFNNSFFYLVLKFCFKKIYQILNSLYHFQFMKGQSSL